MSVQSVAQSADDLRETADSKRWLGLAVIVAAQFMVVLDVAIVNVALPSIKTDLHFSETSRAAWRVWRNGARQRHSRCFARPTGLP